MSTYTARGPVFKCRMNPTLSTQNLCAPNDCVTCGWNPEVNAERRKEIHRLESIGRLREEWGKLYVAE